MSRLSFLSGDTQADCGLWSAPSYKEDAPVVKSVEELQAEIAVSLQDLDTARKLEQAAQLRHARENTTETEAAYARRREEAERIYNRYRKLLVEFGRRIDARSGS